MTVPSGKRGRKPKTGDVFQVPLTDGTFGFGILDIREDCAFFDVRSELPLAVTDIVSHPVIFRIPIMAKTVGKNGWNVLGNVPLPESLTAPAEYRLQSVGSNQLYVYSAGQKREATIEEAAPLEVLAVWYDVHIVQRLEHHFAGTPDPATEYFKIIFKYDGAGNRIED